jgi:3-hydroxyacyl-CoA dehydrogenase
MRSEVKTAAVLGAGTMGSRIAAHLANAGVHCLLLDLPSDASSPGGRNAVAAAAMKALDKSRPPAYFTPEIARRIETGNFTEHLERISASDWIIEAVVENFDVKRELLRRIDKYRKPGTLVSSNTSGLPIASLAEGLSDDFRRHWLGTHFFNPPRHMRLVELIPTPETDPEVVRFIADFCDQRLGKVVVYAKDRPNFIANRIFLFAFMHTLKVMQEQELAAQEVDSLTGPLIGRPRMATFRLADFTGVDVCLFVAETLYRLVPDDEQREVYNPPQFLRDMVGKGMAGDKAGQGFYKKAGAGSSERLALDLRTMTYRPVKKSYFQSVEQAQKIGDLGERIQFLINSDDPAGRFLWATLSELFLYTAARIPEITGDIVSVDTTLKAGFNWQEGLFEIWTKLGVEKTAERMRNEGKHLPPLVEQVLASPEKSFYAERDGRRTFFDLESNGHKPLEDPPGVLKLDTVRRQRAAVKSNRGASLWDLGDGIALLEFHSKANSLDQTVFHLIEQSVREVDANFEALVIGNEGEHFCVGANLYLLLELSRAGKWDDLSREITHTQELFRSLRRCRKPVVAAVFGQTLAGGCELVLRCDRVQAAAETYMGLVETGVGLVPAAGGCAEMLRRHTAGLTIEDDLTHATQTVFELIGMAKVSGSAAEARQHRYLQLDDGITMNRDRLISEAKRTAQGMALAGYQPAPAAEIPAGGNGVLAALELGLYLMREAEYISDFDVVVGKKLAHILSGGRLSQPSLVSEEYLLNLEKEAFLSLCGEAKTHQRIEHVLKTGKPLRN